ncbi:hypothetical protein Mal64_26660 [Pseudobythopirellula maris]|uniref:DUF7691 domain-containing protein n=1 Tax=Pseudobythopirellula maris TaxID=2527991 RepID=A0A5C5ZJX8_9BACT|nr:hypothetical protein [Pseudobythopirellula maris]TWT87131.1 hypothetical protein Mal64_26660 [Pseudobythopirellula maris]
MSYCVHLYAIDGAKLAEAVGGRSEELLAAARENLRELFERDEEERDGEGFSLEKTVELLVMGDFGEEEADYLHGLEALCQHLGEPIDLPALEDAHWKFFGLIAPLRAGFETPLPVSVPQQGSRYKPLFFPRDGVQEILATQPTEIADGEDRVVGAARLDLLDVLESVADDGLDVIGFYG